MIGFIGGGKMAEALIKGITSKGDKNIFVSEPLRRGGSILNPHMG